MAVNEDEMMRLLQNNPQLQPTAGQRFMQGAKSFMGDRDLAMALLANSGYSQQRRSFGQVLGQSYLQAGQMKDQRSENELMKRYREAQIQSLQARQPGNSPFGAIDPDQFTAESLAEFQRTGQYGVLKPRGGLSGIGNFNPGDYTPDSFAKFLKSQDANDLTRYVTPAQPSVQVVNGVPTAVMPDRAGGGPPRQNPLSTLDTEAAAASRIASEKASGAAQGAIAGDRAAKNPRSYEVFKTGIAGLESAMSNTVTGPISGRIPAMTANQQIAQGAEAAMQPVLKQLFRDAGEGTFTEGDQKLLMDMAPTRKDHPEARKAKIAMIDSIVRAKLGVDAVGPTASTQSGPKPGAIEDGYRFKGGNPADPANWEKAN